MDRAHTRQNDGLETGIMGATAARLAWGASPCLALSTCRRPACCGGYSLRSSEDSQSIITKHKTCAAAATVGGSSDDGSTASASASRPRSSRSNPSAPPAMAKRATAGRYAVPARTPCAAVARHSRRATLHECMQVLTGAVRRPSGNPGTETRHAVAQKHLVSRRIHDSRLYPFFKTARLVLA